jgi:hypothetical protein
MDMSLKYMLLAIQALGVAGLSIPLNDWFKNCKWPQIATWSSLGKRVASVGVAVVILTALWGFGIWMGYNPQPVGPAQKWIETWYQVMVSTAAVQQLLQALFPESFKTT